MNKKTQLQRWLTARRGRQSALALYLGVSRQALHNALTGKCAVPRDWVGHIIAFSQVKGGAISELQVWAHNRSFGFPKIKHASKE